MMRTLIDTNILIALEDDHVLGDAFSQFHREASKSTVLLVHPSTKVDIEQDKNIERRAKTLSKYNKYQELEKPPEPDATFISRFGGFDNTHDKVDASLLSAVTHNSVDFLITQDSKLLKKASLFSVDERVLTVDQAAIFFKRLGTRYIPRTTLLQHLPTHKLDISDPFFDSLKKDYGAKPFSDWFEKTKREGRKCWVLFEDSKIQALIIYKEEPQADSISIPVPTLKLCTFKVSESLGGKRIAELMLKLAFQYAIKNQLKSLYLTTFPKSERFYILLDDFGFVKDGRKGGEDIFIKDIEPHSDIPSELTPIQYAIRYYPRYLDGPAINKFIIPIQPQFHMRLFPDSHHGQRTIDEFSGPIPEGNTIKKAYICNARTRQINKGDIVLFYRSKDWKAITSIGIVESTLYTKDPSMIATKVGNRTVYSLDEIERLAQTGALTIIFRHMRNFNTPIGLSTLEEKIKVPGPIQTIRRIKHPKYEQIVKEGQ